MIEMLVYSHYVVLCLHSCFFSLYLGYCFLSVLPSSGQKASLQLNIYHKACLYIFNTGSFRLKMSKCKKSLLLNYNPWCQTDILKMYIFGLKQMSHIELKIDWKYWSKAQTISVPQITDLIMT